MARRSSSQTNGAGVAPGAHGGGGLDDLAPVVAALVAVHALCYHVDGKGAWVVAPQGAQAPSVAQSPHAQADDFAQLGALVGSDGDFA